jgi:hypothetical protein
MALNEPLLNNAELSTPTDSEAAAAAEATVAAEQEIEAETAVAARGFQVDKVNGFWENTYRLVFPFEDKISWPEQEEKVCLTCLNTGKGVIENTNVLKAEKERGLIAFAYAQSVDEAQRDSFPSLLDEKCQKEIEKGELNRCIDHRNLSKFMWGRPDGTIALVQTWKTKYNAEFQRRFKIRDQNPSEHLFEPQAVDEFEHAMKNIFGQDALDKVQVKFCWSSTFNPSPVYIASARALVTMLKGCRAVQEELNINKVEDSGFVSNVVNKKETSTKEFRLEMDETYALYVKKGWDTMACATPLDLFLRERILNRPGLDKEKIPSNLLPISLPDWIYDKEVAKLFFSDSNLVQGTRQIPQPIPINSCVGPAFWWAWARAIVLWTQVIVTTWGFFALKVRLVWVWPFFLLVVLFGLGAEFICVKHFIVPWVQQAQGCVTPLLSLVCPGTGRLFKVWMPLSMVMSIVSMMSIQLNALFVARTWERQWSDDAQGEQEIAFWNEVMDKSMLGNLLDWTFWTPHLAALVLWLISVSQLLVPLISVVRSPKDLGGQRDLTVKYVEKEPVEWQGLAHYFGFRGPERPITPFEALTDMGYAGGMTTVGCSTFSYPLAEMSEILKLKKQGWERDALTYFIMAQKGAALRLFLDFLLKKCLQLKIQVSIYAIHRSMLLQCEPNSNPILYEQLAAIIVTLFTGLATQTDLVFTIIKAHKKLCSELKTDDEARMIRRSNINAVIIVVIALLGAWLSGYTFLQLIMMRTCESSLWNWTGCVAEHEVRAYTNITCA